MTLAWSTLQRQGRTREARAGVLRAAPRAAHGPGSSGSEASRILALQRSAGNRAVTQMIQGGTAPTLQREISIRPEHLGEGRSGKVKEKVLGGTFGKLVGALRDFHSHADKREQLMYAGMIVGLSNVWLEKHAGSADAKDAKRKPLVTALRTEARNEADTLRAQLRRDRSIAAAEDIYLKELEQGSLKGSREYAHYAAPTAKELAAGETPGGFGAGPAAADIVAKYHLTAAEIAAIRVYSLADYLYINPSVANSKSWLGSTLEGLKVKPDEGEQDETGKGAQEKSEGGDKEKAKEDVKYKYNFAKLDPKKLIEEGSTHAGVMMQGLLKLDPYDKPTFRGERLSKAAFATKYAKGATQPFRAFGSSTKDESVAQKFADGIGGNKAPEKDQTVSILAELKVKTARDISQLSTVPHEQEVLILPGTKFKVDDDKPFAPGNEGHADAKADEWHRVFLTEE